MKPVNTLMQRAISETVFPGAVLLVAHQDQVVFFNAYGVANLATQIRINQETLFDLASLTKPLATTLGIMYLVQKEKLELSDTVARVLAEFKNSNKAMVTIQALLTHTSGLPDYRPYFKKLSQTDPSHSKKVLREFLVNEPLEYRPEQQTVYSDLGFMILAWILEQISGDSLNQFVESKIYAPLGIKDLFFIDRQTSVAKREFAATEKCSWRGKIVQGVVHDENAYAVGGFDGHAGLFGNAMAVYQLLYYLLAAYDNRATKSVLAPNLVRQFLTHQAGASRALGFDRPSEENSSAGKYFSKNSVGHLGFTGTSFWVDLDRHIIVILLTNRVHPTRQNERIRSFRPQLHDTIMSLLIS